MYRILALAWLVIFCAASAPAQSSSQQAPDCAELPVLKERLNGAQLRLKDWPNFTRYREANAKLAAPAKSEARIVFMGDSITDGWGRAYNSVFFPGKPYVNRGISGQTTPQMLIRFRADVIALQPRAVVILAGTNDIAGNTGPSTVEMIEDNLSSMAELARAHGIRVVLASVMPVSDYGHTPEGKSFSQTTRRPPEQILALNAWIKKHCAEAGCVYLDYYTATVDEKGFLKKELSEDGLHPNGSGYQVMAPLAEAAITAALKRN